MTIDRLELELREHRDNLARLIKESRKWYWEKWRGEEYHGYKTDELTSEIDALRIAKDALKGWRKEVEPIDCRKA